MVPERAGEVAANDDEAGEQNRGQVFTGRVHGDGSVPWLDGGLHPELAAAQPALQCHGRTAQPALHGMPIASILRFMSAGNSIVLKKVTALFPFIFNGLFRLQCGKV